LGVTLDEKLNFGQHIQNIERKAGNSLQMLSSLFLMGIFVEFELIFPMSLMAISSLLKSKGILPQTLLPLPLD
jgi:hypothetical protein